MILKICFNQDSHQEELLKKSMIIIWQLVIYTSVSFYAKRSKLAIINPSLGHDSNSSIVVDSEAMDISAIMNLKRIILYKN